MCFMKRLEGRNHTGVTEKVLARGEKTFFLREQKTFGTAEDDKRWERIGFPNSGVLGLQFPDIRTAICAGLDFWGLQSKNTWVIQGWPITGLEHQLTQQMT